MTRLILWRHGRTEWNHVGRVQGQVDVDLDEVGVAQAVDAAPRVMAYAPDLIVSSDLRRALRTAEVLATLTGQTVDVDSRLRERHYGPWQGLTQAEIREGYPEDFARWGTADPIKEPGIETVEELAERVTAVLRDAVERIGPHGTAVMVTHGGAARAGSVGLLGWPLAVWPTLGALWNCRITELRFAGTPTPTWRLTAHNAALS
jgi:probable phosphoglycerate mutase